MIGLSGGICLLFFGLPGVGRKDEVIISSNDVTGMGTAESPEPDGVKLIGIDDEKNDGLPFIPENGVNDGAIFLSSRKSGDPVMNEYHFKRETNSLKYFSP